MVKEVLEEKRPSAILCEGLVFSVFLSSLLVKLVDE